MRHRRRRTAPPEYHPLAMQDPPEGYTAPPAPAPARPEPEPVSKPPSEYAYSPEPPQAAPAEPSAAVPPTPAARAEPSVAVPPRPASTPAPPPARPIHEAEPIDLLAVSGAKGMLRKAAPVLIVVGLALVGVLVWLVIF